MTDHDPFDEELRSRLAAPDSDPPDAAAQLDELRPRFHVARRRRQQRVAALSSAAAVLLVIAGIAVLGGGDDQAVDVANDSRPSTTVTTVPSTSTSSPVTTVPTSPTTTTPAGANGVTTTTVAAPSAGATTIPNGPPATTPTAPATTTVPPGGTQVVHSEGGSATVTWTATSLRVDSTAPAAGWVHEATEQKSATRVEVRFRRTDGGSGSSTAKIDARVVDGALTVDN